MTSHIRSLVLSILIVFQLPGCWYQSKNDVRRDLNATEVQFNPPPGTYTEPLDVVMRVSSSKLKSVFIQVQNPNGSWDSYRSPVHIGSSMTLRYRLVYVSDMKVEGDERTAEYVITGR